MAPEAGRGALAHLVNENVSQLSNKREWLVNISAA